MIKIGGKKFETNVFLSPLSGVSDLAFRLMCREGGAGMAFYEMVSSNALVRRHSKTLRLLKSAPQDSPVACQLLGSDAGIMAEAANIVMVESRPEFIDVNAGCPVKKVVKNGQGAALMKNRGMLFDILKRMASAVKVPVTVKLRIGFEAFSENELIRIARGCEDSGASALFVHGRSQRQMYSGSVDYGAIRKVKESVKIPVFGSGDVLTVHLAEKMFRETGCDGILVARGSFGNPGIFNDIKNYLKSGALPEKMTLTRRIELLKKHLSYMKKYGAGTGPMKQIALQYLKGFSGSAILREKVSRAGSYTEILKKIEVAI